MAFRDHKTKQDPNDFAQEPASRRPECQHCDDLLADAVDELLDPAEQAWFDRHIATCMQCQESFAEAKRGAAWLEMLKTPRPEPSAHLLERILAQTSGQALDARWLQTAEPDAHPSAGSATVPAAGSSAPGAVPFLVPAALPILPTARPLPGNVLPFRPRVPWTSGVPRGLSRLLFEPRLAMTAAMAFFSIALTMNMTGVRLDDLHASDLKPSSLRRSYFEATASAARHYESLRVVHVLESRADDLRDAGSGLGVGTNDRGDRPANSGSRKPQQRAGSGQSD